jgi:hypothetical protein
MWQLILGPLLGTAGGLLTKWIDLKEKKIDLEEKQREREHELAVMEKEYILAEKKMTVESSLRLSEQDAATFNESYKIFTDKLTPDGAKLTKKQLSLTLLVDAFNRLIRPISTVYYQLGVAALFSWSAWELHIRGVDALTAEQFGAITTEIIFSIIGMAQTTLFWWFGIRGGSSRAGGAK